jgi:hypothetical protein
MNELLAASAQRVQDALAAAGTPHAVFPTTLEELLKLTAARL